jgi:hypothetical protein
MYFLNGLALFLGGLIPLLAASKKVRLNRGLFLLGWLSWACAISPKIVLVSGLWNLFPFLSKPDTAPYILTLLSLELLEILSAYLFLTRHSRLEKLNLSGRFTFALGFGAGEAFTLAVSAMLLVDVSPSLSTLMVMLERISLVVAQFGWVTLLAFYIATDKTINLALAVFFKIFSSFMALTLPIFLFLYRISYEISLTIFEGILATFALIILVSVLILRKRVEDAGSGVTSFDSSFTLASIVSFCGLALAVDMSIPFIRLTHPLALMTRYLIFIVATMVLLELFCWAAGRSELSEIALGAFIGLLLEYLFRLNAVSESLPRGLTVQAILFSPTSAFLAILAGIAFWRYARHSRPLRN